jgi:AraC family transcriptional regulator, regulatory protein of adaptative response / DNA-3-methyladenine glycosylase II
MSASDFFIGGSPHQGAMAGVTHDHARSHDQVRKPPAGASEPRHAGGVHEDFDGCYRAVSSRDARFDGRFVTAVRTTGIYCRPSCPAQTPRRENVHFFPRPAVAAAAGFRACKRCRPDAAPGSRDWDSRADLAARALRGIETGVVDTDGVPGLARRLAVSERHLHRTLVREIGVGPLALARTRRAQTARMLIEHTTLPLTTVAFSAGFASVRQFNEVMRAEFGAAPSDLRRAPTPGGEATGTLTLRLATRTPYAEEPLLQWLAARAVPGVEEVADGTYRRTIAAAVVEVQPRSRAGHVVARIDIDDVGRVADLVSRVRRVFDLDADPASVDEVLGADPLLARSVVQRPGLRVPGAVGGFELAVRAVLGQQVSVAAARTFAGRLVQRCATPLEAPTGTLTHSFPTAAQVVDADLDGLGLTGARAATLRAIARAVCTDNLSLEPTADRESTRAQLAALPGVGPWTVDYIVMRALADPDAFPVTDLVLQRMLGPDAARRAEAWRPWRAYAAMHLWAMSTEPVTTTKETR